MDRLWAPWRMEYIEAVEKPEGCIFCVFPAENNDKKNHIIYRGKHSFIILNAFPYNPGHLMVAPYMHTADMYDLDDEALLEINHLVRYSLKLLKELSAPDGFNLGVNLGKTAGAGIPNHIHWHIVPRWNGDTNFMPVIAEKRVVPESLNTTYNKLVQMIEKLGVD